MKYAPLFLLLLILSCERPTQRDNRFVIVNDHGNEIVFNPCRCYPDTFFNFTCNVLDVAAHIKKGESKVYSMIGSWDSHFAEMPGNTLVLYFYDIDTVNKYFVESGNNCELLKTQERLLKRMDITLEYLRENNWTITIQ